MTTVLHDRMADWFRGLWGALSAVLIVTALIVGTLLFIKLAASLAAESVRTVDRQTENWMAVCTQHRPFDDCAADLARMRGGK